MSAVSEITIIQKIQNGQEEALEEVYQTNRMPFILFLKNRYKVSKDDALEVFQFTILRLYDNIKTGKLTKLTSSLKSYLFAIGVNVWREQVRARQKQQNIIDTLLLNIIQTTHERPQEELLQQKENKLKAIADALKKMGNPCKAVLEYFYYEQLSMQEIAHRMEYSNDNVAKSKKSKCLKRLKALLKDEKNASNG